MELSSGTKLGPYEIQSLLGAGGMGEVYRARDTRLNRSVAVKVLSQHLSSNPDLKQRFEREARAVSSLNHPRICTLHDIGNQDGTDFLVMELLDGQPLAERLQKGPLPLKEALKIGIEICQALEAAHRAGIVHRDLKPGNVMLTKTGAKLMDFGLAKGAVAGLSSAAASAPLLSAAKTMTDATPLSPLTSAGMVLGTIQYMSPEQIEGKEADARSDLFALGTVLYEMCTGKRAFQGKTQLTLASAILEKDPDPIADFNPQIPAAFERLAITCLAKDPAERIQTAHDVRLELEWINADLGKLKAPVTGAKGHRIASAIPWTIAAALALIAGVALFAHRSTPLPHYANVSYREGMLLGARFSHDGQTVVYSGRWEGEPAQILVARLGSPESRPLGISNAEVAAVSNSDEMAIFMGCEEVYFLTCGGTLATVSLAGGSPRILAEHVSQADWDHDGKEMVIAVQSPEGPRLEYPPGHVLFQQSFGWFGHPRFSPDGTMIAFENHAILGNDDGSVELIDLNGKRKVLSKQDSVEGLAWRPDGKEVWFAGTRTAGWADTLFAVNLEGKERALLTSPQIRLQDIAKDGRVLLSRETWRRQVKGLFPGDKAEHPYSWLDDTEVTGISNDGRVVSIYEAGEIYAMVHDSLAYYRITDNSAAVRLGVGVPTISPDGKWILLSSNHSGGQPLQLQPIGPGTARNLTTPGLVAFDHCSWSEDGRMIVYEAETDQKSWHVYTQAIDGGGPVLLKGGSRGSFPMLSPNGDTVALRESGGISLYPAKGGQPISVKSTGNEYPIRFTKGGKALLVAEQKGGELELSIVDLAKGHREMWKRIPDDYASPNNQLFVATPDLKDYAYPFPRYASVLYTVENLR